MANYDLTYEGSRVQGILDTGNSLKDAGYIFRGEATPSTVPGTPTERVAYIGGPGTYTNFGSSITVPVGRICVFKYTGSAWSNQVIDTRVSDGAAYKGIATPTTNPGSPIGSEFYLAVQAGTYTNFGNAVVTAGLNVIKYNGSVWSVDQVIAIDAEPTQGSANLVKSGGVLNSIIQNGSAFDLSAYNAQGGVLATYADLSAALTALNALPADFKKGGMSMKFVLSSDNKYVQYRLMNQNWSITPSDWQGVDTEPVAGSDNLVKSGGVDFLLNNFIIKAVGSTSFVMSYHDCNLVKDRRYRLIFDNDWTYSGVGTKFLIRKSIGGVLTDVSHTQVSTTAVEFETTENVDFYRFQVRADNAEIYFQIFDITDVYKQRNYVDSIPSFTLQGIGTNQVIGQDFKLKSGNKYRLYISDPSKIGVGLTNSTKFWLVYNNGGTETTQISYSYSQTIPQYIDFTANSADFYTIRIRARVEDSVYFYLMDITYIEDLEGKVYKNFDHIYSISTGADLSFERYLAAGHYYRIIVSQFAYGGTYQKIQIRKVINNEKTTVAYVNASESIPSSFYLLAESCDYYEFYFRSTAGETISALIIDETELLDDYINFLFHTSGGTQKQQFIVKPRRWYRIKINNPSYTYTGVGNRFIFGKSFNGVDTTLLSYSDNQEVAQDEILFYSEEVDNYFIQIRATVNQVVGFKIEDVTAIYEGFDNGTVIDNEFQNLGASDAGFVIDDDYGIAAAHYLCGDDGYGERHQKTEIAWFPVTQPEKAKTAIVMELTQIDGCNAVYLGNGIVRCFYTNQAFIWYKYKDFNVRTGEFVGSESEIKMYDYNNELVSISSANVNTFITDSGISLPQGYALCSLMTSRVKKLNGKYYGSITGFDNYSLIFESEDMANLKIISIVQETAQYELDVRVTSSKIQAVFRKSDGIYYIEADFNPATSVVGTWSTPIKIKYSVDSRPRIIDYNGHRMIIVTYKAGVICGNFPNIERDGIRIYVGDNSDPNNDKIFYEIGNKYAITYPDMVINYDEMYLVHGAEIYGLYAKHVGSGLAGKDCVCFTKIQL